MFPFVIIAAVVGGYFWYRNQQNRATTSGSAPTTWRPLTGRVGQFAWEMDRAVDAVGPGLVFYKYDWRLYDGNVLIANGDEYEKDDQIAYSKAKNQIDATIAKHGGTP